MREMLKEFEEKPKEKDESEDRLEMSLMSRKDRRARKKALFQEQTAGMDKKEKFKYIVYYYKWCCCRHTYGGSFCHRNL